MFVEIPLEVSVRVYDINTTELAELLRSHRTISINDIAISLNKPKTLVEHWFRNDKYFAIPDADIWYQLKDLLGIKTDKFDAQITCFETKDSTFDSRNRLYIGDVAPTITTHCEQMLFCIKGGDVK